MPGEEFSYEKVVGPVTYENGYKDAPVIVNGKAKANILKEALYGPITPSVPASILQLHKNVTVVATSDALI